MKGRKTPVVQQRVPKCLSIFMTKQILRDNARSDTPWKELNWVNEKMKFKLYNFKRENNFRRNSLNSIDITEPNHNQTMKDK